MYKILLILAIIAGIYYLSLNKNYTINKFGELYGVAGSMYHYTTPLLDHTTEVRILFGNAPSKSPIVLIGSCPLDQHMWDPLLNVFQKRISKGESVPHIITYDSRGCGTADFIQEDKDISFYANDLKSVLKHFDGNRKYKVAGWGFGGFIAQKFTMDFPDLVDGVYILSASNTDSVNLNKLIELLEEWRNKYPEITYLTMPEHLVQDLLCSWYHMPESRCSFEYEQQEDNYEKYDESRTDSFLVNEQVLRETRVDEYLHTLRLIKNSDWVLIAWEKLNRSHNVYLLSASDDAFAHPDGTIDLYNSIRTFSKNAVMDVKQGKHGYALVNSEEIADELLGL